VRDPSPALQATLERALREPIVIAVAPARYLERIVEHTYADVDVPIDVELDSGDDASNFDIDIDDAAASFDDIPVMIEPPDAPATAAKPKHRPLPVQFKRADTAARDSLDATIASFADIDERPWLFDVVMGYVSKRWHAALILELAGNRATSVRVHGQKLRTKGGRLSFENVLTEPSIVQVARDERRLVTEEPEWSGIAQTSLAAMLDDAKHPAAMPVLVEDAITHMLVVGDPTRGDAETAATDLEVLAEAIGLALERL